MIMQTYIGMHSQRGGEREKRKKEPHHPINVQANGLGSAELNTIELKGALS